MLALTLLLAPSCGQSPVNAPVAEPLLERLSGVYTVDSAIGPAADLQLSTEFEFSSDKFSLKRGGLIREFGWKLRSDTLIATLNGHDALRYRITPLPGNRLKLAALGTERCLWLRARD